MARNGQPIVRKRTERKKVNGAEVTVEYPGWQIELTDADSKRIRVQYHGTRREARKFAERCREFVVEQRVRKRMRLPYSMELPPWKNDSADQTATTSHRLEGRPSITMQDLVNEFLQEATHLRPLTRESYMRKFRLALAFWGGGEAVESINRQAVRRYVGSRQRYISESREKPVSDSTIRGDLRVLSVLFSFAKEQGYIQENPIIGAKKLATTPPKLPRWLTWQQAERLLKDTAGHPLRPMLATALYAGLRKQELSWLTWADVDLDHDVLHVQAKSGWRPKGKYARTVPIPPELHTILSELPQRESWVFLTRMGKQGKQWRNNLGREVARLMRDSGLRGYGLHALRHTYGSQLALRGKPLLAIQKLMGHASLRTTEIYLHATARDLQSAVQDLSFQKPPPGNHAGPE